MSAPVIAYIDGGARGNPGPAGYGVRIEAADGTALQELTGAIGEATNNVAEYRGLVAALEYLGAHGHLDVVIRSDSQLLTRQMTGRYRVRHSALRVLHARANELAAALDRVRYEHVPRADNARADALANLAMDGASGADVSPGDIAPRGSTPAAAPTLTANGLAVSTTTGDRIIGIGIDIEQVARIDDLLRRYGDRFLSRVFTEREAAFSTRRRTPAQHLAGRFCAKEAAMKALGTGHSLGVLWRDIEVVRRHGPPQLELRGGALRRFTRLGAGRALVTITHTCDLAMAQVVMLGN